MSVKEKVLIYLLLFISSFATGCIITYTLFVPKVSHEFDDRIEIVKDNNVYSFLDKEVSEYILDLSYNLSIDPDLVVSILMQENPEFDYKAVNKNDNGTVDLGLFQINDRYLYTTFKDAFWKFDIDIEPFNWKHNTYIALHLIQDLSKTFKTFDDTVMAYNCGTGAVMSNRIPNITRRYLANVKLNYQLLKSENHEFIDKELQNESSKSSN